METADKNGQRRESTGEERREEDSEVDDGAVIRLSQHVPLTGTSLLHGEQLLLSPSPESTSLY